ncbi:hypothetical protein [Nonomuraea sediminis]|uniref:hypothetical protein n=1 Tax=Nonomuraea sediminis TaxID=2835864 RepID=UPI001BDC7862|nr:hypothetical protein [Nonomuraea sediminis]
MDHVLLSVHVIAGIVFVGGSAVATSLFPRYAPVAAADGAGERSAAVAGVLHRITRGYTALGLIVPVVGIVLAFVQGRMGEAWVTVSMVLTAVAGVLLATQIYPRQREALATPGDAAKLRTLSMLAGFYNLVWAVIVVLMIVKPGA